MTAMKPGTDPYRILGVLRGADQAQIKAAHRRLAKLFHPDGSTGDEDRFLAVQEAYQLLSDPGRRREWDRTHAPGPMRAAASRAAAGRRRARPDPEPTVRRGTPRRTRVYRPPGPRRTTWSAEHVPWWGEFEARRRTANGRSAAESEAPRAAGTTTDDRRAGTGSPGATGASPQHGPGRSSTRDGRRTMDFDVFDRSSGAAWSSAARRHFRRDTQDLPSRGVWRYRGTQVVTGAEARRLADEEEQERS